MNTLNEGDEQGSNSLQYVALPIIDSMYCFRAYSRFVELDRLNQFCAGNVKGPYF